jgi:hypothetical protein
MKFEDTIFYKTFIEANIDRREAQELSGKK